MIDWLTKQISKQEPLDNNKEVKRFKEEELGRENAHDYIRKNKRIHYIDDESSKGHCETITIYLR